MKEKLSVVIPCYNSEKNIGNVINKDIQIFKELKIEDYEFVLVNDCSPDNTWNIIRELSKQNSKIVAINLAKNTGQHGAIMAGFHYVSGDYVVVSDDDGQTQMEMIGAMIEKLKEGYDVVSTKWIHREKRSIIRQIGTKLSDTLSKKYMDNPKGVVLSIFFLARRFVVDEMLEYQNPYPFIIGLILRTTYNLGIVEVEQLPRQSGSSGYSMKKLLGLWMNGFTAFSIAPLRMAAYIGILSAFTGFVYGIYIVLRKLIVNDLMSGWGSIVAIILFMSGIMLCVMGLIGEYVGRIYMCINNTPQYIIKEVCSTAKEKKKAINQRKDVNEIERKNYCVN